MNDFTRIFDDLFADLFMTPAKTTQAPEKIHLELELAGVRKEEIKISAEDGYLRIGVDSKRRKGSRVVSLSKYHDVDKAEVKYEEGLLTVDIPLKKVEERPKKVLEIK